MYFSRLLFSFNYKKSFKYIGAFWSALALTAISYFAIFKGLKGTTLISKDVIEVISENITHYLIFTWLFCSILLGVLQWVFKVNILRIIILAGTAALALSFAGNDLVNFIGVFMAGLRSYEIANEVIAAGGSMDGLTLLLFCI